jgi:hypothetical protein
MLRRFTPAPLGTAFLFPASLLSWWCHRRAYMGSTPSGHLCGVSIAAGLLIDRFGVGAVLAVGAPGARDPARRALAISRVPGLD